MATALKINTATSPVSLKEMSGTEFEYAINQMLTTFAGTQTGVGTLSVNPASTTGLTSIGTFTDTYINALPGAHPVGTTPLSVTYTFYQDQGSAAESLTRPVEYSAGLKEQVDANLNADLVSKALANLVATGVGFYSLQPTTPTGGTWVSISTITNTLDSATTNTTQLWRKTAPASSPSTVRTIKLDATTTPKSIKEMSDAEIQTLTARLRNQIVSTGIGKYSVQATAPASGGTWVSSGTAFLDTRRTATDTAYVLNYTKDYTGAYTRNYTGAYTRTYTGVYSKTFTGSYSGSYQASYNGYFGGVTRSGSYLGNYLLSYTGAYNALAYTGVYSGLVSLTYSKAYSTSFSGQTLNSDSPTISTVYLWVRTA